MAHNNAKQTLYFIGSFILGWLIVGALINYWHNTHYNAQFESNFMTSCNNAGGTASVCSCYYNGVKTHYTYQEAVALDKRASLGDYDPNLLAIAGQCSGSTEAH